MTSGLFGSTYEEKLKRGWFDLPGEQKKARRYDPSLENSTWTRPCVRQSSDPLNLKVPAVRTEIYRIFLARCVNMWNEIPQDVKNAKNLNSFKNKLDEWLNY